MQPSSAPVEFSIPDESKSYGGDQEKIEGGGGGRGGGGSFIDDKQASKASLLDLLPPSPKRLPQVDGPGDSDDEEEKIK